MKRAEERKNYAGGSILVPVSLRCSLSQLLFFFSDIEQMQSYMKEKCGAEPQKLAICDSFITCLRGGKRLLMKSCAGKV